MVTEVYDLETLSNLFTYTGYCLQDGLYYQFVIHKSLNQTEELYTHLKREKNMYQVGYNNEAFDYPVLHYFLVNYNRLKTLSGQEVAQELYAKAQEVITSDEFQTIWDNQKIIKQIDLFLIWHYNNRARSTSLKDLQFAMNMPNIEEMPIHHTQWCKKEDIPIVLEYNKHDVLTTIKFLETTLGKTEYPQYKNKDKIQLRISLMEKFNVNCLNWSDVKIGEQLMLTLYSRAIGANPKDIKQLRTYRPIIHLKDCVPSWCKLQTKEFIDLLDTINNTSLTQGGKFTKSVIFHGLRFDFGLGGSHGCIKPGVYTSEGDWVLYDMDVASLYPSIAKSLGIYPAHLGPEFTRLYSEFIDARIAEKHKPKPFQDMVLIEGYKLILNGTYGKSGEETSWLYDLLYTYKTTIAGQLFIAMWAERMVKAVPSLTFIQINTDGITIKVKKDDIPKIKAVYEQLAVETKLETEDAYYDKMVIKDVNNYIAVYKGSTKENEYIKFKGAPFMVDAEYHQDSSMRIVPIALKNYFVYGVPIEESIKNHDNIYDYCKRLKINSISKAQYTYVSDKTDIKTQDLNRTTRYFVSSTGGALSVNYNGSPKVNRINTGRNCTLFNNYKKEEDYAIDYQYYNLEARKIINTIEDKQLTLF